MEWKGCTRFMSESNDAGNTHRRDGLRSTRWNRYRSDAQISDQPVREPAVDDGNERAGLYLAVFAALLLPILIVSAVFVSSSGGNTDLVQSDRITTTTSTTPSSLVEPVGPADDEVIEEVGETSETAPAETGGVLSTTALDPVVSTSEETARSVDAGSTSSAPAVPAPVDESLAAGSSTTAANDTAPGSTAQVTSTTEITSSDPPSTRRPRTRAAPTTVDVDDDEEDEEDEEEDDDEEEEDEDDDDDEQRATTPDTTLSLEREIQIAQLGDTFVRIRFTTSSSTGYRVVVLGPGRVVATRDGSAVAGQTVRVSIDGLAPGVDHRVQVTLNGPPVTTSAPVEFRTAGGEPEATTEPVELLDLRVVEREPTRIELNYETNICANGSFVIRSLAGGIVGSNSGQESGCTTRHLAIPGFWTAALEPDTSYVITVTVEAGGADRGRGNTASQSMTIRTAP